MFTSALNIEHRTLGTAWRLWQLTDDLVWQADLLHIIVPRGYLIELAPAGQLTPPVECQVLLRYAEDRLGYPPATADALLAQALIACGVSRRRRFWLQWHRRAQQFIDHTITRMKEVILHG